MALTKILEKVTLNTWFKTDIDDFNYCYLLAKKEEKQTTDVVDSKKVNKINLVFGIDSGIENHPIIISRITLSFTDAYYNDPTIDKQVVYAQLTNIPSSFYIKVVSVEDEKMQYSEGSVAISISTNGLKLA